MRLLRILYAYFAVTSLAGYCQSSARLGEVQEPPELAGEPKKFTPPSKAMKQFAEAFPKDDKNIEQVRTGRDKLTKLLQENPDYSDGGNARISVETSGSRATHSTTPFFF
jgi:hypothetical protein